MSSEEEMKEGTGIASNLEKVSTLAGAQKDQLIAELQLAPAAIVVQQVDSSHVELALQETKEQREQRIRKLFSIFDPSNSGSLDHTQIEDGLQRMSIPAHSRYAKDLLSVCDSNQDGKVDYDEFRKYTDDKELELYRIFQEIDVRHNGSIEPDELQLALARAGRQLF